jgi:pimeloyl-ACP methyl ester carboxylesterase
MTYRMPAALRHLLRLLAYGSVGVALTLVAGFILYLESRTDLDVWHRADLDQEFTAASGISSFEEYLELENRLFTQLDEVVYARTGPVGDDLINRYKRGSLADPERWSPNWNRSYEMTVTVPRASVLLLHGLSDSPYSLRNLAERLQAAGVHVLGLRVPGHGTAPSALLDVTWQDMAAAVRLAVRHLAESNPGLPVYVVGYSNGAALAVNYALAALNEPGLPPVDRLVLISPAIGVSSMAALAVWQARLGRLLGLEKLAWNEILPEYEPFKYGSFAVNAGDLSYQLTLEIQRQLDELSGSDRLEHMPPVQAFSSVVDATVLAPALVEQLFNRLPGDGHELVLFDINDMAGIEHILRWGPDEMIRALQAAQEPVYTLYLVTNRAPGDSTVVERSWVGGRQAAEEWVLGLAWPDDVYSLSHVALPFPPGDPLYGGRPEQSSPGIRLGNIAFRGERAVLQISPSAMLRLRWNPFYPYLEDRALAFLGLAEPQEAPEAPE